MPEKRVTPKIEEMAADLIDGEQLKNFLDFNKFLKNNKCTKAKTAKNSCTWTVRYKTKNICSLRVREGHWFITYFKQFKREKWLENWQDYISDELKEVVLSNINTNPGCGTCKGIENAVILGKTFDKVCHCHPIVLNNPDGKTLKYAKELVLTGMNIVGDIAASKI